VPKDYLELGPWGAAMRSLRADRPRFAARGARARTFGAGLEQAEQLWLASQNVGAIASPLLLFYGLTQAGRALCAAGIPGAAWEGAHRHGLHFQLTAPAEGSPLELRNVGVRTDDEGLVNQVADVVGSPVLSDSASLSDLISSLDSDLYFDDDQYSASRPLEVYEYGLLLPGKFGDPARKALFLGPLPDVLASNREYVPAGPNNLAHTRIVPPSAADVAAWLSAYPRLRALGEPTDIRSPEGSLGRIDRGNWVIRLMWGGDDRIEGVTQSQWTLQQLDVVYSDQPNGAGGVVLPSIGGNIEAQRLLVTWWLVLYCLSMLARYYPTVWTKLLDVDSSSLAVPFDHLISVARAKVPRLIFDAVHELRAAQASGP
jgi:YaaC-like Protein